MVRWLHSVSRNDWFFKISIWCWFRNKKKLEFIFSIHKEIKIALFVNYTFHIDQEFDASTTMLKTNLVTKKDVAMLITAGGGSVI